MWSVGSERIPALGEEGFAPKQNRTGFALNQRPDAEAAFWRPFSGWQGKKQLVVFAPVERLFECRAVGDGDIVNAGRDSRCKSEPVEVERKAVAEIHAGGGAKTAQSNAGIQAGHGADRITGCRHRAEPPGDIEEFTCVTA